MVEASGADDGHFVYADFEDWYLKLTTTTLQYARESAQRMVEELLDEAVPPLDRGRYRITGSRVKSSQRLYKKARLDRYRSRLSDFSDIPRVIDDLVGLRLVCNNISDVDVFSEIVAGLPVYASGLAVPLAVEEGSVRDYFAEPKETGYRAFHVNLVVLVPRLAAHVPVRVEVQVRTLLQDGWGELTHEDTYKPGSVVPEWITRMSLRMAELLAAVDSIAQDVREQLDIEASRAAGGEKPHASESMAPTSRPLPQSAADEEMFPALSAALNGILRTLDRPRPLAAVSQTLVSQFGTAIAPDWGGQGSFKTFVEAAAPAALVTGPPPGYIHPLGKPVPENWESEWLSAAERGALPPVVQDLARYERGLPRVSRIRIQDTIEALAAALTDVREVQGQSRDEIDAISKSAVADAGRAGKLVVRSHVAYLLAVLRRTDGTSTWSAVNIAAALFDHLSRRGVESGLSPSEVDAQLGDWLMPD